MASAKLSNHTLLIHGYCRRSSPVEINDYCITSILGLYYRSLSHDTTRAIASAHFFARIVDAFQSNEANKCPFVNDINLLNYAYVRGGAMRDIMLNRVINDIDIVIDLDKLHKAYSQHLDTYHTQILQQSPRCCCFAWQRYLNMYKANTETTETKQKYDDTEDPLVKYGNNMIRSNFLLNALFFKEIIMCSSESDSFDAIPTWNCTKWVIKVCKPLIYKGIDLNGARIDICDEMDQSEGIKTFKLIAKIIDSPSVLAWSECFEYIHDLKHRISNDDAHALDTNNFDFDQNEQVGVISKQIGRNYEIIRNQLSEQITIHLPVYSFLMKYSTQFCDYTLNGIRLPLSMVYDPKNYIDTDWRSKVLHYSHLNDLNNTLVEQHNILSMHDIKNKIIRQPDLGILSLDYVYSDYFWRFVKLQSKFDGYCVDKHTLKYLRAAWKQHFWRLNGMKMRAFCATLCVWRISKDQTYEEYVQRLKAFKQIGFDKDLKKALRDYDMFPIVLHQVLKKKLRKKHKINGMYKALQLFGYKLKNPDERKRKLVVKPGYKYSGSVFNKWFTHPIYTSSKTNSFKRKVEYWKGKECKRLFVNNFDVIDEYAHKEFTKIFYSFGDLSMDPIFDVDVNGDPFAIVHFQFKEDAVRCFDQHNYSYDYLRIGKNVLFVDYDRDPKRKKKKVKEIVYDNDTGSDCDSYKKWHFKCTQQS